MNSIPNVEFGFQITRGEILLLLIIVDFVLPHYQTFKQYKEMHEETQFSLPIGGSDLSNGRFHVYKQEYLGWGEHHRPY